MSKEDFASLLEASLERGQGRTRRRLENGEAVEGTVLQIGSDSVFVDVGATSEGRVPRAELEGRDGELRVKVGDTVRATVVDAEADTPLLAVTLGKGALDVRQLAAALDAGTPVTGRVTRAVKGGLEVDVGGVRAFCPASQVELGYAQDLAPYEGQELEFKVLEIKEDGRSVVLSRRALLDEQRRERESELQAQLVPGSDLPGTITSLGRHGAIVDIGGVEGFVHLSELAHRRIERAEDVVSVGDRVEVRVLGVEQSERGLRVRLSMKARAAAPEAPSLAPDEVLAATVVRTLGSGVIVSTPKGEGLVPLRELGLAPGADHRRAFPTGKALEVVVLDRDAGRGRVRFSAVGVARVQERRNYREFASASPGGGAAGSLGSLGDVLRKKLGLPDPPPVAPAAPEPSPPEAAAAPERPRPPPSERRPDPAGVVRRKR